MNESYAPSRMHSPDRTMQIGLFMPLARTFGWPGDPTFPQLKAYALQAESIGLDSLWFPDHFISPPADGEERVGWWEMWSVLSALASATQRVTLGAYVNCLLFRNPGVIAKQAEAVDEISGGRFVLGLGAGWNEADFSMFGLPFDRRVSRLSEGIEIVSALLKRGQADYQGEFYRANDAWNLPRGPRAADGGVPLLIGGRGPRILNLVARYADIWDSDFVSRAADLVPLIESVDRACEAAERDPATLARSSALHWAREDAIYPWGFSFRGGVDEIADEIVKFRELGFDQLTIALVPATPHSLEQLAGAIELAG